MDGLFVNQNGLEYTVLRELSELRTCGLGERYLMILWSGCLDATMSAVQGEEINAAVSVEQVGSPCCYRIFSGIFSVLRELIPGQIPFDSRTEIRGFCEESTAAYGAALRVF